MLATHNNPHTLLCRAKWQHRDPPRLSWLVEATHPLAPQEVLLFLSKSLSKKDGSERKEVVQIFGVRDILFYVGHLCFILSSQIMWYGIQKPFLFLLSLFSFFPLLLFLADPAHLLGTERGLFIATSVQSFRNQI
jgi:hypothetical protein